MTSKATLFFTVMLLPLVLKAQERVPGLSNTGSFDILTEKFVDRPLVVHKGQLQFNSGYELSIRSSYYDEDGSKISLRDSGTASTQHQYRLFLHYGILEFLEVNASINYLKRGERSETVNYLVSSGNFIETNMLHEYKGWEDLHLGVSVGLPFDIPSFDWSMSARVTVPIMKSEPDKPSHTVDYPIPGNDSTYYLNLKYNNNLGLGVPSYVFETAFKFRTAKLAGIVSGHYSAGMKSGSGYDWTSTLEDGTFRYEKLPYTYRLPEVLLVEAYVHYQAVAFFDVFLGYEHLNTIGGWKEQGGRKVANYDLQLSTLSAGFEIQVSPMLRLHQQLGFPLGGKNINGSFFIFTGAVFNFLTR